MRDPTDMAATTIQDGDASPPSASGGAQQSAPTSLPFRGKHPDIPEQTGYPTPPLSNSSSFVHMVTAGMSEIGGDRARSRKRSWDRQLKSGVSPPSTLRRHTLTSALTATVVKPHVSAHISHPCTSPTRPAAARHSLSTHAQNRDSRELTQNATREQNTPPQTPRSGSYSHENKRAEELASQLRSVQKSSRSSSGGSQRPTVGQAKGQLEICIEEGRGLRPSVEPYVICIFQQNEDISGGPKEDAMDTRDNGVGEENLAKGVAMKRLGSGSGTPISIPGLRSRQTSQTNIAGLRRGAERPETTPETTDPQWRHTALFDVVGENNEVDISVYDRSNNEAFIGHVRLPLNLDDFEHQHEDWYKLTPRDAQSENVTGEIRLKIAFHATGKKVFGPDDFEILKLIGKGTFGQVFQVRKKDTKRIYAMKVLSKKVIVQKKEIQHTIGERNILVRTATSESPFIVGLKFSFQTAADLYLVTDYMSGGELFLASAERRTLPRRASEVLHRRADPGTETSAPVRHRLPRSQTREHPPRRQWTHCTLRLRPLQSQSSQERHNQYLLRHHRVPRTRGATR